MLYFICFKIQWWGGDVVHESKTINQYRTGCCLKRNQQFKEEGGRRAPPSLRAQTTQRAPALLSASWQPAPTTGASTAQIPLQPHVPTKPNSSALLTAELMLISLSVNLINLGRRAGRYAQQFNRNRRGSRTTRREPSGNHVNF